jgi:glucose-6-phosphate isomerase
MIHLDYTFMTAPAVDGGLTEDDLVGARDPFAHAREAAMARRASGEVGFFDVPRNGNLLRQSTDIAARMHERGTTDAVILGIGGSALGPVALHTALRPSGWNALPDQVRGGFPRLHVLDNVDPVTIAALLQRLDLRSSLFVVISKSGSTAETMAQYLLVRGRLESARLRLRDHVVLVTDPERGTLRDIARSGGIVAVDIPPNVGGRFSVLTPVGVLPAALVGIDVVALLRGADEMRAVCDGAELALNPAGIFAIVQWLADTRRGRHTHVFMPYSDQLRDCAAWFVQLWAESLGKVRADGSHAGPTPIAARGASDQHSQMQLFMEGPADKTVTFVTVNDLGVDLPIPDAAAESGDLSYLGGHRLGELLSIEQRATAASLAKRGRLSMTISLDRVDAWHVGALFMLLEIATAFAGELYGVNAFDQPGVELAKRFTYALLGRPGFEEVRAEWDGLPRSDPRHVV